MLYSVVEDEIVTSFVLAQTYRLGLAVLAIMTAFPSPRALATTGSKTIHCGDIQQHYVYYLPGRNTNLVAGKSLPAIVLLHGAGDRAENMIEAWSEFAEKKGIVLIAPQLPRDPKFEESAPKVFRCIVEDGRTLVGIDPARVYLFGNSMGGYLAYDGAMFESRYFAAIAVHAMRIADDYAGIVNRAVRKTPVAIYIGDRDQFFTEDSVRQTRDLLRKSGFPVRYVELRNHDHNYYAASDQINSDAWKFFEDNPLPREAQ